MKTKATTKKYNFLVVEQRPIVKKLITPEIPSPQSSFIQEVPTDFSLPALPDLEIDW